ncbi:protein-disulfide reductase DsbD [Aestuariibacter halophilus]|uniref:Thiol:disulfide interchange protein DsbD n=1 Tax=Fluctibacter halophilus TaxID=226011 RepID=A0ABS8GD50_9ALTE|nr:protein-disulfide reductase DsbD [Aestuariibacter halophilus]MCC2617101.1 protein-disulfide reductase DsbD [Aestuariibacter halophilus]
MCMVTPLTNAQSADPLNDIFAQQPTFLDVDDAFRFDYVQQGDQLTLSFSIAPGYYLYKKQFKTVTKRATVSEPQLPHGEEIEDEFFGVSEVYFQQVSLNYTIEQAEQDGVVKIQYQGCAEAGLCYPPTVKVIYLEAVGDSVASDTDNRASSPQPLNSPLSGLISFTQGQGLLWVLLGFVVLGIGLAFTPCVYPMYPILSGIVVGQGKKLSLRHAFALSFVYVQGMALTYSLLGLVVASAGAQFQATLQQPLVLGIMITLFVLLALVMFGMWELQMPSAWQSRLNALSNQQKSGRFTGVFVMGVISGLVASPCTTAPLTAILLNIAQTGDMVLGFVSLYALSLGMGIPLILFGTTGGKLLPKAGHWMNVVKVTFGFAMLSVALVFVERLVSHWLTEIAWSLLALAMLTYLWVINRTTALNLAHGIRTFILLVGILSAGFYGYHHLPIHQQQAQPSHPTFTVVKDLDDFNSKLAAANAQGKSVMVDLYADWCVACKEFEKYTFVDPDVIAALGNTEWMQIDLTDNTPTNQAFQDAFSVLGLPTILFFDHQGKELTRARVTGFMSPEVFAEHVRQHLGTGSGE